MVPSRNLTVRAVPVAAAAVARSKANAPDIVTNEPSATQRSLNSRRLSGRVTILHGDRPMSALPQKSDITDFMSTRPRLFRQCLGPVTAGEGPHAFLLPRVTGRRRCWPSRHFETREQFNIARLSASFQ